MRHLFLINPHAGKYDRTQEMREKLRTALAGRDEPWEAAVTQYPGHGAELARAAAERGEPVRIYACGGDGTLNEAVAGAAGFGNAAVTHYPMGSGNDFLRMFGPDACRFYDLPGSAGRAPGAGGSPLSATGGWPSMSARWGSTPASVLVRQTSRSCPW